MQGTQWADKKEEWRQIEGYEGLYDISSTGRVRSYHRDKTRRTTFGAVKCIMRLAASGAYLHLMLSKGKRRKNHCVHRLVARAFIPNPDNKPQVNHINGDRANNNVDNLEWCTAKENMQHAHDNKLIIAARGRDCATAKLSEEDVLKIRSLYPEKSIYKIAKPFNVWPATIHKVVTRQSWKHI